jgi:hypothetical protein
MGAFLSARLKPTVLGAGIAFCLASTLVIADTPANEQQALAKQVLANLMSWLPGDFNNAALLQLPSTQQSGESSGTADKLLTTHIRRVTLPAFGDNVLFLEEYRGADHLERIRLYVFEPNDNGSVRLRLLNPKDPQALQGARNTPDRLRALTPADVTTDRRACELNFSQHPDGIIIGRMTSGSCDLATDWVDYELHVGPQGHWVCYSRRTQQADTVAWQLVPQFPCVLMNRTG